MILLVAFGVTGLLSAKNTMANENANVNEKSEDTVELCGVYVTFYDNEGNATGSAWYTTFADTLQQCQAFQGLVKWNLQRAGFVVTG